MDIGPYEYSAVGKPLLRLKDAHQTEAQHSGFGLARRSKGASAVFAIGGNGEKRTLRRRSPGLPLGTPSPAYDTASSYKMKVPLGGA